MTVERWTVYGERDPDVARVGTGPDTLRSTLKYLRDRGDKWADVDAGHGFERIDFPLLPIEHVFP